MTNCTWPSPVVGGWETQTRLVDVIFRALLPALPAALPAGTKAMMCHAGFGGVDPVTNEYSASSRRSAAATAGGSRATAPTPCRRTARTPRTRPSRRPSSTIRSAWRGSRSSTTPRAPAASAAASVCARTSSSTGRRPSPFSPTATLAGPAGAFGGHDGRVAEYVLIRDGEESGSAPRPPVARGRRRRQLPHLRRRRLRPARGARSGAGAA